MKRFLLLIFVMFLSGCGGGGNGDTSSGTAVSSGNPAVSATNDYFTVTSDEYGLINPTFYYSTDNASFWSIQANVAQDVWDVNTVCVFRIDIPKSEKGAMPDIIGKTFSLEANSSFEQFPGTFLVFNGHKSTQKKVDYGTISFASDAEVEDYVRGAFNVTVTDYDSTIIPPPQYRLKGTFGFKMGTYATANPLPAEVYPENGRKAYDRLCSSCHSLGNYDSTSESAPNLSLRGGELPMVYPGTFTEHQGINLDPQTFHDLRIFLNAQ